MSEQHDEAFEKSRNVAEVMVFFEVLQDALGTQALGYSSHDNLVVGFSGAYEPVGTLADLESRPWLQRATVSRSTPFSHWMRT